MIAALGALILLLVFLVAWIGLAITCVREGDWGLALFVFFGGLGAIMIMGGH